MKFLKDLFAITKVNCPTKSEKIYQHKMLAKKYGSTKKLFNSLVLMPAFLGGLLGGSGAIVYAILVFLFMVVPIFIVAAISSAHQKYHDDIAIRLLCDLPVIEREEL